MKTRQTLVITGIALLAYVLGVLTAPVVSPRSGDGNSVGNSDSRKSTILSSQQEGESGSAKFRSHERPPGAPDSITIPSKSIKNLIANKSHRGWDYRYLADHVSDALTILGATDEEHRAVGAAFEKARAELVGKEKELARVTQPDPSKIEIDLTAVKEHATRIVRGIQDDLRTTLPSSTAEILISSIEWGDYYIPGGETSMIFTIERSPGGRIHAYARSNNDFYGQSVNSQVELPEDTPIQARAIFGNSWGHLLQDLTILPTPRKP